MLGHVVPKLKLGVRMLSVTMRADAREGDIGMQLGGLPSPSWGRDWKLSILRSAAPARHECGATARDAKKLAQAKREVEEMLERVRRAQSRS
jgi:hypothetical protein